MQLAGVVILFNPDKHLIQNIQSYAGKLDLLLVVDNSETLSLNRILLEQLNPNTIIVHDGKNEGIAKRINYACKYAIEQGFTWLLTMDQDSRFDAGSLDTYLECINHFKKKDSTAMFGISHEKNENQTDCTCIETINLITSGSMVNLTIAAKINFFNEALFIDEVDTEYCYRAKNKGYSVCKLLDVNLIHDLGVAGSIDP